GRPWARGPCAQRSGPTSANSQVLMRLQAELPLRMGETIGDGTRRVLGTCRAVHRLQREATERQVRERFRWHVVLRIDQLQLVSVLQPEAVAALGTDAQPVDAGRRLERAVGLDRDLEAARMELLDQRRIDLQQRLAAGQHDEAMLGRTLPLLL